MSFSKTLLISLGLASLIACGTVSAAEKFGADRHVARGVSCQMCHGPDMKNPVYPDENTCIKCHPKAAMARKLKSFSPIRTPLRTTATARCATCSTNPQ